MGFIGQPGGTTTKGRGGEITTMRFLTYEVDKCRDGSKPSFEDQRRAWKRAGLPEPSLTVNTGGSSLHIYWLLTEAVPLAQGEIARKRLFHGIQNANPKLVVDFSRPAAINPATCGIHPQDRQTVGDRI